MIERLREHKLKLLKAEEASEIEAAITLVTSPDSTGQFDVSAASNSAAPIEGLTTGLHQPELDLPGLAPLPLAAPNHPHEEQLIRVLSELGLTNSPYVFDDAVGRVRARLFGPGSSDVSRAAPARKKTSRSGGKRKAKPSDSTSPAAHLIATPDPADGEQQALRGAATEDPKSQ
jgi:hypothetical protein